MGDWDIRGPDYDTVLIGAITDAHIDADRLARIEHQSGFPSWALYRTVYAGDTLYLRPLKDWVIAFACAFGMTGGVKRSVYSDDFACVAGLDALHCLMHSRPMLPDSVSAIQCGVTAKTYTRFRNAIFRRLLTDLLQYWAQLGCAYRQVRISEWKCETPEPRAISVTRGIVSRFGGAINGDGCWYVALAPDSDSL